MTTSSVTATSVAISWTQPPFSFIPVGYTVTLARVTGNEQVLCSTVADSRPTMDSNVTAMEFTDLHEFSTYTVMVTPRFSEFGDSITASSSARFTTLSAGKFTEIASYR